MSIFNKFNREAWSKRLFRSKPLFLDRLLWAVGGAVRYKLLVLVLFPILLVMPIALVLAIYWGSNFSYEQLFIKVNTDLSVSHDAFRRIREDYLNHLGRLAESYAFRTVLEAEQDEAIQQQLDQLKHDLGLSYLDLWYMRAGYLAGAMGVTHPIHHSASLLTALEGRAVVGVEIFSQQALQEHLPALGKTLQLPLIETPRARPTDRQVEDRGMMVRALYPIKDPHGKLVAVLDGGLLLNANFAFVDAIRDLVYGPGSLPEGSIGTVTVFLDDVRISTNVPLGLGERALGTRVSNEVRTLVLDEGATWIDRAFVVNDWYISSYEPILDVDGRRVGMLYAGFLESPFRNALWQALAVLVLLFLTLMLLSAVVAVRGAKSIFKPLEVMSSVVRATRSGEARRIGLVRSRDEIGELARELDGMLNLLDERKQQLQQWADQLEEKVDVRTEELRQKNTDLQRTIRALRQTRQQLVEAEKLAALGELTAGVAHEIHNPTAVMLGNLDLLVAELGPAGIPVKGEIQLIIDQIYRIKEITNHLLQYARPDEYAGYLTQVDVNEAVHHTEELIRHLHKSFQFSIELDLKATQKVEINLRELQQVLVNLISNAVHAVNSEGGLIRVLVADWSTQGVVIRVQDNGVGMDEDQISRIFNPFFSTKGQGEGSGLGLSVSYGLIRRYGGNITVESTPGEGSEFTVWLLREPKLVTDEETLVEQLFSIQSSPHTSSPVSLKS